MKTWKQIGLVGLMVLLIVGSVSAQRRGVFMLEEVGRNDYGYLRVLLEWTIDHNRVPCIANSVHCEIRFELYDEDLADWRSFRHPEIIHGGTIRTGRVWTPRLERGIHYRAVLIATGRIFGEQIGVADVVEFIIDTEPFDPEPPETQNTYSLPLVLAADTAGLEGFVRIINRSAQAGNVNIRAIDDHGMRFDGSLAIDAMAAIHINSRDLERGNPGIGNGEGNWRLELTTNLDIQPLAYIRTADGFVTAMHDVAPVSGMEHSVPFFNPGSNTRQVSRLRIFNPGSTNAEVTITGRDDAGDDAPGGTVRFTLPARSARTLTAQALEAGGAGFNGRLGDGAGKWRLSVTSNVAIQVMSLLASPTGHISNLSTAPVE